MSPEKGGTADAGLIDIIKAHPFFAELHEISCEVLGGCAKNVRFKAGDYVLSEGSTANELYLIREGRISLEIHAPGKAGIRFQTVGPGEVVGVSWLVRPYRWAYDARALEPVRAISLDAQCLRSKCDADHDLGYEMMNRFVPLLVQRLQATRLQLLDLYGHDG